MQQYIYVLTTCWYIIYIFIAGSSLTLIFLQKIFVLVSYYNQLYNTILAVKDIQEYMNALYIYIFFYLKIIIILFSISYLNFFVKNLKTRVEKKRFLWSCIFFMFSLSISHWFILVDFIFIWKQLRWKMQNIYIYADFLILINFFINDLYYSLVFLSFKYFIIYKLLMNKYQYGIFWNNVKFYYKIIYCFGLIYLAFSVTEIIFALILFESFFFSVRFLIELKKQKVLY